MKLRTASLLFTLTTMSFALQSCDSSGTTQGDISQNLFDRAKTLENLLTGDTIDYTATSSILPTNQIVFSTTNEAFYTDFSFTQQRTGLYKFNLQANSTNVFTDFIAAINTLYATDGALPGTDGAIDDSFRRILFRPGESSPDFTRIELENIAAQLTAAGGGEVFVHPTENFIVAVTELSIDHESVSNNDSLIKGIMRGTYSVSATAQRIYFRRPSGDEVGDFNTGIRGITPSHWLPTIGDEISIIQRVDSGSFVLQLANKTTTIGL